MTTVSKSLPLENNDIYDTDIDLRYSQQFRETLDEINKIIIPKFNIWDKKALNFQKYRQNLMIIMILAGFITLIVIIPEIGKMLPENWEWIIQNLAAVIVLISILVGVTYNFQKKWLLYRHKSELMRLLKFHGLLDPTIFSKEKEVPLSKLKQYVDESEKIDEKNFNEFILDEFNFWKYDRNSIIQIDEQNFLDVINYYQEKRIKSQIQYFEKRAKERERIDYYTKNLPKITSFIGVSLLILYFIFGIFLKGDMPQYFSFLIIIAAILPAIGSLVKSYRTTNEITRIASIYRTRQKKLSNINNELISGLKQENRDINKELALINESESILKNEHQEWLRLMIQSEWVI